MLKSSFQFFGLPGSGKTTVVKSLSKKNSVFFNIVPIFSRWKRFYLFIFFIICFPKRSLVFFTLIFKNPYKLWNYLFHLTSVSFASHMYVLLQLRAGENTFLIDEGLLQRFLSVAPGALPLSYIEKVVNLLIFKGDLAVMIKGGDFKRFVHDEDRFISPRNKMGDVYFRKWATDLLHNIGVLRTALTHKGLCLEIDNTNKENLSKIIEEVQTLIIKSKE